MRHRRTLLLAMATLLAAMVARMAGLDGAGVVRLAGGFAVVAAFLTAAAVGVGLVFVLPMALVFKLIDLILRPRTPEAAR